MTPVNSFPCSQLSTYISSYLGYIVLSTFCSTGDAQSQDWHEITKHVDLVCAKTHRQELIQDLHKTWQDPGTMFGHHFLSSQIDIEFRKEQKMILIWVINLVRNIEDKTWEK